jgi:TonB family protein
VRWRLDDEGRATSTWICRSSGNSDLDAAALQWFRGAVFDVPKVGSANRSPDGIYEDTIIFGLEREARSRGPAPSNLANVRPWRQPDPVYPRELIGIGKEGDVTLVADVSTDGRVRAVVVEKSSGSAAMDAAAAAAAFQYEFTPLAQPFRFARTFSFRIKPGQTPNPAEGQEVLRP